MTKVQQKEVWFICYRILIISFLTKLDELERLTSAVWAFSILHLVFDSKIAFFLKITFCFGTQMYRTSAASLSK